MKMMKKHLSLALAGTLLLGLLAGCASGNDAPADVPADQPGAEAHTVMRWGTDSEPTGFDPHTNSEEASIRVMNQLYETLIEVDADMKFYGQLAESWEIPDPTTYIFKLRQDVKFHSGRAMTAADVVYTFDRVLGKSDAGDIGALGNKSSYYGGVTSVVANDDYTVTFTLAEPNAAFLNTLTSNYGAIVDKDVIAEHGDLMRADGGTGPFTLGEWLPDNYVKITKFADYWEVDRVKLDGITYFLIGDEAARLAALRTGEIDFATLSAANVTAAEKEESLKVFSYQTNDYIALGCNLSTPALQDKNVRQAMSYGMDRQAIIDVVFSGQAALTGMVPPGLGHWSKDVSALDLYKPNMNQAKALMETAGYSETNRLTLKVAAGLMDSLRQAVVVLQQQLAECYIDLEITNLESGEYVDIWGKMSTPEAGFDLMILSDGAGTDPNRSISFFFGTGSGANTLGFTNERIDELCAMGIATTDEAEREKIYNEAQDILLDDCTKLCIASPMKFIVAAKNMEGFAPSSADASNFRDTYFS